MRTTFLVGRLTPKSAQIVVVNEARPSPIRGPWTLRAMTRGTGGEPTRSRRWSSERIH